MPKKFLTRQVFYFLASFLITFILGFLAWDAFVNEGYVLKVLAENVEKTTFKNSTASVSSPVLEEIKEEKSEEKFFENKNEMPEILEAPEISREDQLDDIAEKLDIIQAQVDQLLGKNEIKQDEELEKDEEEIIEEDEEEEEKIDEEKNEIEKINYPKILIFETKISPSDQRFIKLFNPNSESVDLTGWYLQRKTATGTDYTSCITKNDFAGKIILANNYLIITKEGLTLTENNSLILKNPNGEISDIAQTSAENPISTGGGGGGGTISYPKILISEVQIAAAGDEKQEFFELYNPNDTDINLTGWYLQRKTSESSDFSTYASKSLFSEKNITAKNYFLIARDGYYLDLANIFTDKPITDGNSFVLKNPNGEISDMLDLLATTTPSTGQSIGRFWNAENNTEGDFELQTPTPKFQNITWTEPILPTLESIEITTSPSKLSYFVGEKLDISDLQITGHYSDGTSKIETITEENISGFDSSVPAENQIITITFSGFTATYEINILENIPQKNILITELQIEGETKSYDFIKFYNPNDSEVFLNNYNGKYLRLVKRAKTSTKDTTIKSWSSEADVKISAKSFYLWASSTDENYPASIGADTFTKQNISDDNGIALRCGEADTGEIIDAVGWGDFSNVLFENNSFSQNPGKNQKLIRIKIGEDFQDVNDNSLDFSLIETTSPSNL